MGQEFEYDIFLSHSAKDKAVVRPLAERLRKDQPGLQPLALAQILCIDWFPAGCEQAYAKLLD
jgi:hypothetical protein